MSDPRGPELKSIMAKTELVVEVGLKHAVYEDFVYFPFQFFRMTVSLLTKNPGSNFEVVLKIFKRLHPIWSNDLFWTGIEYKQKRSFEEVSSFFS